MAQVSGYDETLPVRKSEGSNPSVVKNQGSIFVLELLQLSNRTVVGSQSKDSICLFYLVNHQMNRISSRIFEILQPESLMCYIPEVLQT